MRAIVCGAGRVGYGIASRLAAERANVTVIDRDARLIRQLTERLDVRGVVGSGSYPDVLVEAGAREADMVIAVTASDEVNIVACQIAHSVFQVPTKIARIRAKSYLENRYADVFSRDNIPIDVIISPERAVAESVMQRLVTPAATEVVTFADERIWGVGVRLRDDCPVLDTPLRQIRELFPDLRITIVGVRRGEGFFRATSTDQLAAGDEVFFVCAAEAVERALQVLGEPQPRARRVIIVGGGNIGFDVARSLEARGQVKIRLIEQSRERAAYVAERLEKTIVLEGSGLDREVLREAGVADAEAVVCLTNSDQVNVLSAVIAKREGARRTNVLVNEADYGPLAHSVGIDRAIDPRATTVSMILQHVRRGRIKAVFPLMGGEAELVDAVALETSKLVGRPLHDANLPSGVVIGAILRGPDVLLPDADTVVEAGDRVVLMTLRESVEDVQKMFRVGFEYF